MKKKSVFFVIFLTCDLHSRFSASKSILLLENKVRCLFVKGRGEKRREERERKEDGTEKKRKREKR